MNIYSKLIPTFYLVRVHYRLYKVYPHRTGKSPIIHGIGDVAPIVGKSSLDVVIHAPPRSEHSVTPPPNLIIEGVRVRGSGSHNGGDIRGLR